MMPDEIPQTVTKDKLLFTPGPLTTSSTVKAAMLRDLGSRDREFMTIVRSIRQKLLTMAGLDEDAGYTIIPVQGSGTFGIEAVISSVVPGGGRLLVVVNGAYGRRIDQIAATHDIDTFMLRYPENAVPDLADIERVLREDATIDAVAVVHCETTTGILNPIAQIGRIVQRHHLTFIVDAMSSFGAIPIDVAEWGIDYLVSSSNKCIEGVPGFSFVVARLSALLETDGLAHTLSLDLLSQWQELERSGQFRFTPPTHAMLAFHQALLELEAEGGVEARAARYRANHAALIAGMRELGFREYLAPALQSYIITSFHYPEHPHFQFETFYELLSEKGFVIYPGKLGEVDCFRIGTIGRIYPQDISALLTAIRETMDQMGIR